MRSNLENADSARRCRFRNSQQKRASDLDPTYVWIPKLDVAGSSPSPAPCFQQAARNGRRFGAPGHGRLGVNVNRHANAVPALVGRDLWIDLGIMAETGMGSAQHPNPADWALAILHT